MSLCSSSGKKLQLLIYFVQKKKVKHTPLLCSHPQFWRKIGNWTQNLSNLHCMNQHYCYENMHGHPSAMSKEMWVTLLPSVTLLQLWIKLSQWYHSPMQKIIVDAYLSASQTAILEKNTHNSSHLLKRYCYRKVVWTQKVSIYKKS